MMRIPSFLLAPLRRMATRAIARRAPDFIIGREGEDYLRRWWILPRNRFFNIYLHEILRSDDDRALHDHSWLNLSILLDGGYFEHTIAAGGIHRRKARGTGDMVLRGPRAAHRLEIDANDGATTLFITGPRLRNWGFHCPEAGWVPWQDFTAAHDPGQTGKGCGE